MKTEHKGRQPYEVPAGADIDWKESNKAIGLKLDWSPLTVMHYRQRNNIPAVPRGRPIDQKKRKERIEQAMLQAFRTLEEHQTVYANAMKSFGQMMANYGLGNR